MTEIKRFFECLIPVTTCNLKCEYCYVIQRNQNTHKVPELNYSPEVIGVSLTQDRLGGVCYFSICGAGETFIPDYLIDIVYQILQNGHYVNITTNGTLTKQLRRLSLIPSQWLTRLHISFSFHYLELLRLNLINTFFDNIDYVRDLGCSFLVQVNLYDGYLPHLDTIKALCVERTGAAPQLVATRKEVALTRKIELMTSLSTSEYIEAGKNFFSPLFDFTMQNFNVQRKEFCYAGDWSYTLNLCTGVLKRCYASCIHQNIFKDPQKPLFELATGNCCASLYCLNSSHFMSLGVIPECQVPTYQDLRNRENANWYTNEARSFLDSKLNSTNEEYGFFKKIVANVIGHIDKAAYKTYRAIMSIIKK